MPGSYAPGWPCRPNFGPCWCRTVPNAAGKHDSSEIGNVCVDKLSRTDYFCLRHEDRRRTLGREWQHDLFEENHIIPAFGVLCAVLDTSTKIIFICMKRGYFVPRAQHSACTKVVLGTSDVGQASCTEQNYVLQVHEQGVGRIHESKQSCQAFQRSRTTYLTSSVKCGASPIERRPLLIPKRLLPVSATPPSKRCSKKPST